jgi:hypothetical protein
VPDVLADHRTEAILHGQVSEDRQDQPAGEWAKLAVLQTAGGIDRAASASARFGLKRARAQWEAARIADYTVESRIACFCPGHFHWTKLSVQADRVISADPLEPLPPGAVASVSGWKTVVELFDFIEDSTGNYEDVEVRYHATLGALETSATLTTPGGINQWP